MGEVEKYKLDDYEFEGKTEYEQAKREWDTISNLEKKMNLGDPKIALNLYNQAVSNRSFKTPVGYAFLKRLRDTIISCGLVGEDDLNRIPVVSVAKPTVQRGRVAARKTSGKVSDEDFSSGLEGMNRTKLVNLYEKEKKKRITLSVALAALVCVIIAMFVLTMNSKYSYITYFTDYENDIRESIINEYEEWEQELNAREKALEDNVK